MIPKEIWKRQLQKDFEYMLGLDIYSDYKDWKGRKSE